MQLNSPCFHQGNKAASLRIKQHRLESTSTSATIKNDNYGEISLIEVNKNTLMMMLERKHASQ